MPFKMLNIKSLSDEDFKQCLRQNKDKKDPEAYCAQIHKDITGDWPNEKSKKKSPLKMIN